MAALPPATVMVKGFRRTLSLVGIRAETNTLGMNRVPTANVSAQFQSLSKVTVTYIQRAASDYQGTSRKRERSQMREAVGAEEATCPYKHVDNTPHNDRLTSLRCVPHRGHVHALLRVHDRLPRRHASVRLRQEVPSRSILWRYRPRQRPEKVIVQSTTMSSDEQFYSCQLLVPPSPEDLDKGRVRANSPIRSARTPPAVPIPYHPDRHPGSIKHAQIPNRS